MERAAYTIRLQNVPEKRKETKEELTKMIADTLVESMKKHYKDIKKEIDCISRVRNT